MVTQGAAVLQSPEHFKLFQVFSRETNFIFRSKMAESLGNMKFLSTYSLSKDSFQEVYFDELMELVSDSDNMVKITAFEAVAKLIHLEDRESYLNEKQVEEEIIPALLKLTETVVEDEDGMQLMSNRFGLMVNSISRQFE
jgi:hypothetical protein